MTCFECDAPADHEHHVVPRILGGTRTIPLCERHHGMVHDRHMVNHRTLTRAGHDRLRAQGKRMSRHPPYGYQLADDGKTLVPVESEQAAIVEARALRARGMSLRDVAGTLAARGVVSRTGKPFTPSAVSAMIG